MVHVWKNYRNSVRLYNRNRLHYRALILFTSFLVLQILVPICGALSGALLSLGHIPYLSYDTIPALLVRPHIFIPLLILLLGLICTAYFQFTMLLLGLREIRHGRYHFRSTFKMAIHRFRASDWRSLLLLAAYILFVLPFAGVILQSEIFSKVQIPKFVVAFILTKPLLACLYIVLCAVVGYIGVRSIYALPLMILEDYSIRDAFAESARLTRRRVLRITFHVAFLGIMLDIGQTVLTFLMAFTQGMVDNFCDKTTAAISAVVILTLIKILMAFYAAKVAVVTLFAVLPQEYFAPEGEELPAAPAPKKHFQWKRRNPSHSSLAINTIFVLFSTLVAVASVYAYSQFDTLVISHRGVDGQNGVQNTIPAMKATIASAHPDYIEIDLHETADGEFVLMHDENLSALCGVDTAPHNLTLAELTALTASENGFSAPVASFDDYLAAADALDQKLLIEIKTTGMDTPDMVERFIARYGEDILTHGHRLHSLDYNVVLRLAGDINDGNEESPYFTSLILPLTILYPHTNSSAYTVEETMVNRNFIASGNIANQMVFVWTVNDISSMQRMLFLRADGIITDYPSLLREQIEQLRTDDYSPLIQQFRTIGA